MMSYAAVMLNAILQVESRGECRVGDGSDAYGRINVGLNIKPGTDKMAFVEHLWMFERI